MKMKTGRDIELEELVSHHKDNHQLMNGGVQLREDPEDEKRKTMDLESQGTGNFFSLRAAVLGLWVPCVVGKTEYSFLLVSVTSYVTKTMAFLLAWLLAYKDIVPQGTFLLHCIPYSENYTILTNSSYVECHKISDCFGGQTDYSLQKIRICGKDNQDTVLSIFGTGVIMMGIISLGATYLLHKITFYEHLFNVSKTCCWIRPCPLFPWPKFLASQLTPIIHRDIIFKTLESNHGARGSVKMTKMFTAACKDQETLKILTSRQLQGETPLGFCAKNSKVDCANVLLNNGAKIEENDLGEHPLTVAVNNDASDMVEILMDKIMDMDDKEIKKNMGETKRGILNVVVDQTLLINILQNDLQEKEYKLKMATNLVKFISVPIDNLMEKRKRLKIWFKNGIQLTTRFHMWKLGKEIYLTKMDIWLN